MGDTVGTLKTVVTASAAGFIATMNQSAAAAQGATSKIRTAMMGLSSAGHQLGGMVPQEMMGFIDFLSSPKLMSLSAIGTVFGLTQKMAQEAKETFQGASKLGMGVVAFQELAFAATKSGSSIEEVGGSINKMRKAISEGNRGGQIGQTFKELGLSVKDLESSGVDRAFEKIATAVTKIQNPMERARIEMELFGKSGATMEPLLEKMAKGGLDQYRGKALSATELQGLEDLKVGAVGLWTKTKQVTGQATLGFEAMAHDAWGLLHGRFGEGFKFAMNKQLEAAARDNPTKGEASQAAESLTPSALAPLAMQGSQAAYAMIASNIAETMGGEDKASMLETLKQIQKNTEHLVPRADSPQTDGGY